MLPLTLTPPPWSEASRPVVLPGAAEVLLEHRDLARLGRWDTAEILAAADWVRARGLKAVLVWDVLASDTDLANGGALLRKLDPTHFDAVRVQDPGVALYVRQHHPDLPLQWVLETGNHNLPGIQAWVRELQPARVVLGNELPLDQIERIAAAIEAEVEILALGRLLIFYSPRALLSPAVTEACAGDALQRFATSVEDNKHFPVIENRHGTFMFYEKDLFLLPFLADMARAGVAIARLDLKFFEDPALIPALTEAMSDPADGGWDGVRACLGPRVTRGFFKANRTDKQFPRLKNVHLRTREDLTYVGTVVEARKRKYLALHTQRPFAAGDRLRIAIPEGRELTVSPAWIRDMDGHAVGLADPPGLWLIDHHPRVSPGSRVYLLTPDWRALGTASGQGDSEG